MLAVAPLAPSTASNVKRILDAMAALARALPGGANAHLTIGVHACDEGTLLVLADQGGRIQTYVSDDQTQQWDACTLPGHRCSITAYGLHRAVAPSDPIAQAAVESALAQAQEAL